MGSVLALILGVVACVSALPLFAVWGDLSHHASAGRPRAQIRRVAAATPAPSIARSRPPVALRGCGAGRCAYCHDQVAVEDRAACASCHAVHHVDCWEGRCASCGAGLVLGLVRASSNRTRASL
jgi:hypothetical protein